MVSGAALVHEIHPKHPLLPPNTPYTPPKHSLNAPSISQKALTLSRKVNECKPLAWGAFAVGGAGTVLGTAVAYVIAGPYMGPDGWKVAACLCASYVGGSLNYAATAQALGGACQTLL